MSRPTPLPSWYAPDASRFRFNETLFSSDQRRLVIFRKNSIQVFPPGRHEVHFFFSDIVEIGYVEMTPRAIPISIPSGCSSRDNLTLSIDVAAMLRPRESEASIGQLLTNETTALDVAREMILLAFQSVCREYDFRDIQSNIEALTLRGSSEARKALDKQKACLTLDYVVVHRVTSSDKRLAAIEEDRLAQEIELQRERERAVELEVKQQREFAIREAEREADHRRKLEVITAKASAKLANEKLALILELIPSLKAGGRLDVNIGSLGDERHQEDREKSEAGRSRSGERRKPKRREPRRGF